MSDAVETLFLPFASGDIDPPGEGERFAFLNAAAPQDMPAAMPRSALVCEQGFRPQFLALERAGFTTLPELDANASAFASALVLAGKHKGENHALVARACRLVSPGGTVCISGDKTIGIQPLRKWAGDRVDIDGSLAKHHATVFWFRAPEVDVFADAVQPHDLVEGRFETAPGMFSHGKPDAGSVLLAEHFDQRIKTGAEVARMAEAMEVAESQTNELEWATFGQTHQRAKTANTKEEFLRSKEASGAAAAWGTSFVGAALQSYGVGASSTPPAPCPTRAPPTSAASSLPPPPPRPYVLSSPPTFCCSQRMLLD